jgi:hypothetical protein
MREGDNGWMDLRWTLTDLGRRTRKARFELVMKADLPLWAVEQDAEEEEAQAPPLMCRRLSLSRCATSQAGALVEAGRVASSRRAALAAERMPWGSLASAVVRRRRTSSAHRSGTGRAIYA